MSGYKLLLIGTRNNDNKRVVIKLSSEKNGKNEIAREHNIYKKLQKINFTYRDLVLPEELLCTKQEGVFILVAEFIEQEQKLIDMSPEKQFFTALDLLKMQEGSHVSTYAHAKSVKHIFDIVDAREYVRIADDYIRNIKIDFLDIEVKVLDHASTFIKKRKDIVNMYSRFLVHDDFVPHNIRIAKDTTYLIDHTSFVFGNKYESWARFINYMELYNPELAHLLVFYVRDNRTTEEYESLRAMRVYKLLFLLQFYTQARTRTTGDLLELSTERIRFWMQILQAVLEDRTPDIKIIDIYKQKRDQLRSQEETQRQVNM